MIQIAIPYPTLGAVNLSQLPCPWSSFLRLSRKSVVKRCLSSKEIEELEAMGSDWCKMLLLQPRTHTPDAYSSKIVADL